jgi:YVTN family beta-propeller protein
MTRSQRHSGRIATLAGSLVLASLAARVFGAELSGTLIVANQTGGSVSLIDLDTEVEIARVPIGPRVPHEIAVSPDGRFAVTGEYGGNDDPGRRVVVIDVVNARIKGYVDLGPVSRPHSFAFLPDGRRVVATMEQADRIALVDIEHLAVLKTFPTGGRQGHMVRVSPDGASAYVASRGGEGTLSVISLRESLPPVVIATGEGAEGLAVSPDGTEVWVVNRTAGTISVVNTGTLGVVATLPVRVGAGRAEFTAAGGVLVPNGTSGAVNEKYLTLYDQASRSIVADARLGEGPGAYGVLAVGAVAFVSDRAEGTISILDLDDFPTMHTIVSNHPNSDGLGYSPLRVAALEGDAR